MNQNLLEQNQNKMLQKVFVYEQNRTKQSFCSPALSITKDYFFLVVFFLLFVFVVRI